MVRSNIAVATKRNRNSQHRVPLAQRRKARRLVLQALYQWLMADLDPKAIAKQFREETPGKVDWDYFEEVFSEIPNSAQKLDEFLAPLLDRDLAALDPIEKSLLYLGSFELTNRIDVPYRVVINECVELAKIFGATDSYKYINGVLDKLAPTLRPAELLK